MESSEWVKMLAKTNETEPYNNISPYRPHLEPAFAFPIMLSVDLSLFETKGNFSRACRQLARDAIKSVIFSCFSERCADASIWSERWSVGADKGSSSGSEDHVGGTAADKRLFVETVLYRYRAGIPWRDLPVRFGDFTPLVRKRRY